MRVAAVDEVEVQDRLLALSLCFHHRLDLLTDSGWFLFQLCDAHELDSGEALSGIDSDSIDIGVVVLELSQDSWFHRLPDLVGHALHRHSVRYSSNSRDALFPVLFKLQSVSGVVAGDVDGERWVCLDLDVAFLLAERQIVSYLVDFLCEPEFCDVGLDFAVEVGESLLEPFSVVPGKLVAVDCPCESLTYLA